ncbi:MAG: UDP-N-acetylglucosamine 2-epimerase (non-hydrolyzing), partial [Opitutales bacterium]|nr:UDP-N-acetylglucosamine 2-epimerase (non-hydrolyzing) [Opitutales bacterium]
MKKVVVVAGTRPEVIKMAPLYLELKKSKVIEPIFLSTAQHRQMLDQALSMFDITPDFDMDIMQAGQTLSDLTARLIVAWKEFFEKNSVDAVLVQGDTTTVLSSAIAAFYHKVKIGHVEAGLRTFNMLSPFPEEMNRRLVSPLANWSFAPTSLSYKNLVEEKIDPKTCFITGNTVVDALLYIVKKLEKSKISLDDVANECGISEAFKKNFLQSGKKWILVTGHRRESFGKGFENICNAIKQIVTNHPDCGVLYPVHLNPQV